MLHAILNGKSGRIETNSDESVSWRTLFKAREDLLTAAVFGRFSYLSPSIQANLMCQMFNDASLDLGEFEDIDFWPSYQLEDSDNKRRVEPDLVLRFTSATVIVEIKPPAGGAQYYDQWYREVAAFEENDDGPEKSLYFLAIGNIDRRNSKSWCTALLERFAGLNGVGTITWSDTVSYINELNKNETVLTCQRDRRILADILKALSLYGLNTSGFEWSDILSHSLPRLTLTSLPPAKEHQPQGGSPSEISAIFDNQLPHLNLSILQTWSKINHEIESN
ncbi:hypothetical protein [uncultured Photobacterium sp.]|uniref:hypothetical protein n=1 Tax=uncultured Photobacterium sp. TaxID=173973 RepID=UPI0026149B29|nr:hypothetical protein [uncultured Photobacterium sp.]